MLAGFGVMSLLNTVIIYLAAVWLMLLISPWLTLAAVGPLPLMVLLVRKVSGQVFTLSRETQEELARLSSLAEETLTAVRLVKSYCREEHFSGLFRQASGRCLAKIWSWPGCGGWSYRSCPSPPGLVSWRYCTSEDVR